MVGRHKFLVDTLRQCVSPSQRIMQGLRIIFVPTILILRYFYPHQLIGVYSGIVLHERKAGSRKARWYVQLSVSFFRVREGLLLIMVPFSVMFCLRVCCCLLLLCSRVPSPAVLCVHRPLLSLLNSHAPARRRRTQLIHWIVLSPSPSNRSNEQNSSGTYFSSDFFHFFLSFSSVLRHWRSRLRFGEVTNRRSPSCEFGKLVNDRRRLRPRRGVPALPERV